MKKKRLLVKQMNKQGGARPSPPPPRALQPPVSISPLIIGRPSQGAVSKTGLWDPNPRVTAEWTVGLELRTGDFIIQQESTRVHGGSEVLKPCSYSREHWPQGPFSVLTLDSGSMEVGK